MSEPRGCQGRGAGEHGHRLSAQTAPRKRLSAAMLSSPARAPSLAHSRSLRLLPLTVGPPASSLPRRTTMTTDRRSTSFARHHYVKAVGRLCRPPATSPYRPPPQSSTTPPPLPPPLPVTTMTTASTRAPLSMSPQMCRPSSGALLSRPTSRLTLSASSPPVGQPAQRIKVRERERKGEKRGK